jgi:hypothetical protein
MTRVYVKRKLETYGVAQPRVLYTSVSSQLSHGLRACVLCYVINWTPYDLLVPVDLLKITKPPLSRQLRVYVLTCLYHIRCYIAYEKFTAATLWNVDDD